jgi:hypothetical protein
VTAAEVVVGRGRAVRVAVDVAAWFMVARRSGHGEFLVLHSSGYRHGGIL